jgi:hypothetical protein
MIDLEIEMNLLDLIMQQCIIQRLNFDLFFEQTLGV